MTKLSSTQFGTDWLARFSGTEHDTAASLIDELLLVTRNELGHGLYALLDKVMEKQADPTRPIALFVEREVEKTKYKGGTRKVLPLFPDTQHGRATGPGVAPIVIGNLITSYCRLHKNMALSHPGPDEMRTKRVGRIVVVTDFIGSGKRVWEMLEAFRLVATLRSWRSYGLIEFHVVAYSGTEAGLQHVEQSRLAPAVATFVGCPTLGSAFTGNQRASIIALCRRYPKGHQSPLGFGYSGALIAFAHGVPNNVPPILHSSSKGWTPLFRGRSTAAADAIFPAAAVGAIADRAARLLRIREIRAYLDDPQGRKWLKTMIVLAAIEAGARTLGTAISSRTGLQIAGGRGGPGFHPQCALDRADQPSHEAGAPGARSPPTQA